jgi:transcriptional regulator with XRE-family HTH domain
MIDRALDGARPIPLEALMTKRAENAETVPFPRQDRSDSPPVVASNLTRLRGEQGLDLDGLAAKSGVPRHTLRALETGSEEPTIKTLWSLANALGVPFSALIANERPSSPPPAVRSGSRKLLASKEGPRSSEVYEIKLPAHGSERALARVAGALENALVTSGYAEIRVEGAVHRLATGESASFPADVERRYFNPRDEAATLYLVISEPVE